VQDYGNVLLGASRRGVKQVRSKRDQGTERLLDDSRQDIAVLAESRTAERSEESARYREETREGRSAPECADHLEHDYCARADLTDVIASEEGLGAVKQFRPPLREVIRDE
jgi:hypothetical protein